MLYQINYDEELNQKVKTIIAHYNLKNKEEAFIKSVEETFNKIKGL